MAKQVKKAVKNLFRTSSGHIEDEDQLEKSQNGHGEKQTDIRATVQISEDTVEPTVNEPTSFSLSQGIQNAESDNPDEYVVIAGLKPTDPRRHHEHAAGILIETNLRTNRETEKSLSEPNSSTLMDMHRGQSSTMQAKSEKSSRFVSYSQGAQLRPMLPGIFEQNIQKELEHKNEPLELTAKSLFSEHLVNNGAYTQLFLGTAIVSGIDESCPTTAAFRHFLQAVIHTEDETQESATSFDESNKCMSSHNVVLLGKHPYSNMTWLLSHSVSDDVVMCLISYFAKKLKERCNTDYYNLLKFSSSQNRTSEEMNQDEVPNEVEEIFSKLEQKWNDRLKREKVFQEVISAAGVGLVKVFNILRASEAVMDILPFINKYCKQSFHIIGYNRHATADFAKDKSAAKNQLLRLIHGSQNSMYVFLTGIELDEEIGIDPHHAESIPIDDMKSELQLENICTLSMDQTNESIQKMKQNLEQSLLELGPPYKTSKSLLGLMFLCTVRAVHSRKKEKLENKDMFWMPRKEIEELYNQYRFPTDETLDTVLKFFTSFGEILFFDNVIALQQYVIVDIAEFVNQIHELYMLSVSDEPTAKFGLIKHKQDEQCRVIIEFLTTLGIATEVKSNQIICTTNDVAIDTATTYYYIPTIQKLHTSHETPVTSSWSPASNYIWKKIDKKRETAGNMQARMCSFFLQNGCFLIPTMGTETTVRFFNEATHDQQLEQFDIKFMEDEKELMVHLTSDSAYPDVHGSQLQLPEVFHRIINSAPPFLYKVAESRIKTKNLNKIAQYILKQTTERQESFSSKLGWTDCNWIKDQKDSGVKLDIILDMFDEFQMKNSPHKLRQVLHEFDKQLHKFL